MAFYNLIFGTHLVFQVGHSCETLLLILVQKIPTCKQIWRLIQRQNKDFKLVDPFFAIHGMIYKAFVVIQVRRITHKGVGWLPIVAPTGKLSVAHLQPPSLCAQMWDTMGSQGSPVKSYDYLLKFLLVGDSDVGKGEILDSLQDGSAESPYAYSSGESFLSQQIGTCMLNFVLLWWAPNVVTCFVVTDVQNRLAAFHCMEHIHLH